jgi:hypothetical protein
LIEWLAAAGKVCGHSTAIAISGLFRDEVSADEVSAGFVVGESAVGSFEGVMR